MATPFDAGEIDTLVCDIVGTFVDEDATFRSAAERMAAEADLSDPTELQSRWMAGLDDRLSAFLDDAVAWRPRRELVTSAARDALESLGGAPSAATDAIAAAVDREHRAWPDVAAASRHLCRDHVVVALSNSDLDALVRLGAANDIRWHAALSTGTVQTVKPDPAAYRYAIDALAIDPERALFVAAHPWDLRAAADQGFRTAYVARPGAERPTAADRFDLRVDDLAELGRLLGEQADPDA